MTGHGEYRIENRQRYIYIELRGSFNVEGARTYLSEYRATVESRNGFPFGILIDARDYTGLSPDAARLSDEFNDWLNTVPGFLAKAVISTNRTMVNMSYFMQPATVDQTKMVFENEADAETWLLLQLDEVRD
jgi:hypothetical protein